MTACPSSAGNSVDAASRRSRRTPARSRSNAGLIARAEVVRRAPAAERDPVVGGPLAVHDQVPVVGERLAARPARRGPRTAPAAARWRPSASTPGRRPAAARQRAASSPRWRGRRAARARSRGSVTAARCRRRPAARSGAPGCCSAIAPAAALAPPRPARAPAAPGAPARQCGVQTPPSTAAGADPLAGLRRRTQLHAVDAADARRPRRPRRGPGPAAPGCGPAPDGAARRVVRVDALRRHDPAHLVDRVAASPGASPARRPRPCRAGQWRRPGREQRRAPAAVAAAGAEARRSRASSTSDPQRRVGHAAGSTPSTAR